MVIVFEGSRAEQLHILLFRIDIVYIMENDWSCCRCTQEQREMVDFFPNSQGLRSLNSVVLLVQAGSYCSREFSASYEVMTSTGIDNFKSTIDKCIKLPWEII